MLEKYEDSPRHTSFVERPIPGDDFPRASDESKQKWLMTIEIQTPKYCTLMVTLLYLQWNGECIFQYGKLNYFIVVVIYLFSDLRRNPSEIEIKFHENVIIYFNISCCVYY